MIKFLKPVQGRVVPDPERGHKPMQADGRRVEMSTFWERRLEDQDVVEVPGAVVDGGGEEEANGGVQ
jgi:hypothetical protein